jgi:hypothetical protein
MITEGASAVFRKRTLKPVPGIVIRIAAASTTICASPERPSWTASSLSTCSAIAFSLADGPCAFCFGQIV